jgi:hypothetical protein
MWFNLFQGVINFLSPPKEEKEGEGGVKNVQEREKREWGCRSSHHAMIHIPILLNKGSRTKSIIKVVQTF